MTHTRKTAAFETASEYYSHFPYFYLPFCITAIKGYSRLINEQVVQSWNSSERMWNGRMWGRRNEPGEWPESWDLLNPHGTRQVVLTAQKRSHMIVFEDCSISKCVFCCHSGCGSISSCSPPQRHSSTNVGNQRGVWWAPESLSSETWLPNEGGRKWNALMDCKTLGKMTNDRYITLGAHCCCLRTWTELKGDARQPLVVYFLYTKQLSEVQRATYCSASEKRRGSLSFTFYSPTTFILFRLFLRISPFLIKTHGGRVVWPMCVPMGIVDRPSAPERHFSHFIFLLYHSRALTWHDPWLIWILESSKPVIYSFFVFYVGFLLCGVTTEWKSFFRLAFLLGT